MREREREVMSMTRVGVEAYGDPTDRPEHSSERPLHTPWPPRHPSLPVAPHSETCCCSAGNKVAKLRGQTETPKLQIQSTLLHTNFRTYLLGMTGRDRPRKD